MYEEKELDHDVDSKKGSVETYDRDRPTKYGRNMSDPFCSMHRFSLFIMFAYTHAFVLMHCKHCFYHHTTPFCIRVSSTIEYDGSSPADYDELVGTEHDHHHQVVDAKIEADALEGALTHPP